mmetsp:Transcript_7817/g.23241  ORF Transcript_7817/g.23241 Transcript_7817/m.23241 type:complete len:111 (-) Transcript_7817:14-346(-)
MKPTLLLLPGLCLALVPPARPRAATALKMSSDLYGPPGSSKKGVAVAEPPAAPSNDLYGPPGSAKKGASVTAAPAPAPAPAPRKLLDAKPRKRKKKEAAADVVVKKKKGK